jgi:hypothetical protein
MRFFEFLRNRDVLTQVFRILQEVARAATTVAEARRMLAERLAEGAKKGDFDDALRKLAESDALVEDFINNG